MSGPLAGRTALVTGGGRGLGFEIARELGRQGAHVLLNGRDADRLADAVEQVLGDGSAATSVAFDLTDPDAVEAALQPHLSGGAAIDILVNNAAVRDRRGVLDLPPDDFSRLLRANLDAAYGLTRRVATRLVETERPGSIVNVSSVVGGLLANRDDAAYATAKAGLEGLTRALAADLGSHGIRVNAVAPGFFATEANADQLRDPDRLVVVRARTMLRRWGRPAEIAGIVAFLAGDAASYVTGQTIAVDGGLSRMF